MKDYWCTKEKILVIIDELHRELIENYKKVSELTVEMQETVKDFNKKVSLNEIDFLDDSL